MLAPAVGVHHPELVSSATADTEKDFPAVRRPGGVVAVAVNEVPAIADAEASCSGKGTFTQDATKSSDGDFSSISAATAQFDLQITGCPATTTITLFHIHNSSIGVNCPVVVDSGQKAIEPIALTNGATAGLITKTGITVTPETAKAIIHIAPGFYFNVHSQLHGGGVIRGQLVQG